ncbi:MAG: penicillin-binding protein 2 [Candidatus Campbellbacteria bacterium]|nr:penicillin-binding protein 2 [Candidatus Campbellbacteria bacterium]
MRKKEPGTLGLKFILVTTFVAAIVIVTKLFFIQIVEGNEYENRAANQYIRPIHQLFNRGDIYMQPREGEPLPVAMIETTYVLYINPQVLSNPVETFKKINEITEIDEESYFKKTAKLEDPYEILKRDLPEEVKEEISDLNIKGVSTHPERKRYYPSGSLASQVIGFMSYDKNELVGTYGIEREFQDILEDKNNEGHINIFAEVLLNNPVTENNEREGNADVVLTLEPSIQIFVEKELKNLREKYNAKQAGAIVMDPNTGKIVSMASSPTFDLNQFSSANSEYYSNPNVSNVYEMGSIMKALTMAVGLESGAISTDSTFYDKGYIEADGYKITNVYKGARGETSMQGIIDHSMNTGASWIVDQVGKNKFADYFRSLGLGERTGISLPSEASGLIDNLESPRKIEYYTASFGQGIATTPIATVRALSALANGGKLVDPYIVDEIYQADGSTKTPKRNAPKQIFSEETTTQVSRMLVNLVDETLDLIIEGDQSISTHTVAAKTGTAQVSSDLISGYSESDSFHSFFGYFPAYDPKFIVFLWVDRPEGVTYASGSLTSPFFNITNYMIDHYAINPDR